MTRRECERSRFMRDRGSPAVIGTYPLDRWLCVPAFRRVCPCHFRALSVKASPMTVKGLYCVRTLNELLNIFSPPRACDLTTNLTADLTGFAYISGVYVHSAAQKFSDSG